MDKLQDILNEVLITFGKKAYPKFNTVVVLAGGAGSGKGFVKNKLLGIEGYSYDVDDIKSLALKAPMISKKLKNTYGLDISKPQFLKNPDNVTKLHMVVKDLGLDKGRVGKVYDAIKNPNGGVHSDRKPNIIFDVTMSELRKLNELSIAVTELGYDTKDIHIVWVVAPIDIAVKRNKNRDRVVPEDVLINTHEGASMTINTIISMGSKLSKYMNGDIYFAFSGPSDINFVGSDVSDNAGYIKDAAYFQIKEKGKPIDKSKITKQITNKIIAYTPKIHTWEDGK